MADWIKLVKPKLTPPLDEDFCPAVLANHAFEREVSEVGVPLVFGLEREAGKVSRIERRVFPEGHPRAGENLYYADRLLKFLGAQRGGHTVFVGGPRYIGEYLQNAFSAEGVHKFEHNILELINEQPFQVVLCDARDVPPSFEPGSTLGRHLDGCRIGFDLGASDRKASAVVDGQVVYSEEVIWEPTRHSDPEYHYREIMASLHAAASKMPRLDAIGGSIAGVIIDNRPRFASIFRSVPKERYHEITNLFLRIRDEMKVPLVVIGDGDVAALAGSMALNDNGVLGISMGSSEAAGYVDMNGHILGWANSLSFAPVDYNPRAAIDEWSSDIGCGSVYFSQQCVFNLAPRAGINIPTEMTKAEKLKFVQEKLEAGDEGAQKVWQSMGVYLGYGLAHYADFYELKHAFILGRCTSGRGGMLILDGANAVLQAEFPELAARLQIHLPDDKTRRIGQSVAAASLPDLGQ